MIRDLLDSLCKMFLTFEEYQGVIKGENIILKPNSLLKDCSPTEAYTLYITIEYTQAKLPFKLNAGGRMRKANSYWHALSKEPDQFGDVLKK